MLSFIFESERMKGMKMKTSILIALLSFSIGVWAQQTETSIYENGQVRLHQFYFEGEVIQSSYHENGQVKEVGQLLDGKPHGEWRTFDENGKPLSEGYFENGEKVGLWKVQALDGMPSYRMYYIDGIRQMAIAMDD